MTRIKICGITTPGDARGAAEAGADAVGFVLADSPRQVTLAQARACSAETPPFLVRVGVLMDAPLDEARAAAAAGCFDALQLHGDETPEYCKAVGGRIIKRFNILEGDSPGRIEERLARYAVAGWLLDPGAGGGRTFDWSAALGIRRPLIVSGGLTPENVGQVVRMLRPYAVDVASGVESSPGRKDMARMRAFIQAVRAADADGVTG